MSQSIEKRIDRLEQAVGRRGQVFLFEPSAEELASAEAQGFEVVVVEWSNSADAGLAPRKWS